ncbi:MAG: aldehyde dehydrogenase family protein [Desulfobacter sp.]|nr:MAG: aldehyde dehydrogenase family protein [Desulfobacter sp.]
MNIIDNDLLSIQEARILAENAFEAQKILAGFSQEKLDRIVESMAEAVEARVEDLALMSHEETEYGIPGDKLKKNQFVCGYARRQLRSMRCVGIINEDRQMQMMDVGVPMGVVLALCPATSPVSTTLYNAMIAVKSGNSMVFSPHPRARKTMGVVLDIIISAAQAAGMPKGAVAYLHTVAAGGTRELMNHSLVSMILNTGVPSMLADAEKAGKPLIYAGTGNGPAFIERTADVDQAVKDIIASKTFDNGIVAAAEQSIVVDGPIDGQVRAALEANGAYFMTKEEADRLAGLFYCPVGGLNPKMVGICARDLAFRAGITVPGNVSVLIAERKYVSPSDPYLKEKLCPILTYYVEEDWREACEKCIEILLTERGGHTLVIHSGDEDVIRQFALKKPVARVLVNTPATLGGMGATTNMFPSMTLGSGSAGHGITSDNVSPLNLIYVRKVGYGVRKADAIDLNKETPSLSAPKTIDADTDSEKLQILYRILKGAVDGKVNP